MNTFYIQNPVVLTPLKSAEYLTLAREQASQLHVTAKKLKGQKALMAYKEGIYYQNIPEVPMLLSLHKSYTHYLAKSEGKP